MTGAGPRQKDEPRRPNYLFRRVFDAWVQDGEYWVWVDMSKVGPGFPFTKGMTYAQCIDSSIQDGGMSNPLPQLANETAPDWWLSTFPPWAGYVLVDFKEGNEFGQWAVFAPNVKASAKLAPSVIFDDEEEWLWPAVMKGKGLLPVTITAITNSDLVSVTPQFYTQPETRAKCRVIVRQWWTVDPWTAKTLPLRQDVYAAAKPVRLGYPGQQITIRCLHEKVSTIAYPAAGIQSIEYPATDYTTWRPDTTNKIREIGGRYFREEREYIAI